MKTLGALTLAGAWALGVTQQPMIGLESLLIYGPLGIICAYLFWERWIERKADRQVRHGHANVLLENTAAIHGLKRSIRENTRIVYFALQRDGLQIPPPDDGDDDTPNPNRRRTPETR